MTLFVSPMLVPNSKGPHPFVFEGVLGASMTSSPERVLQQFYQAEARYMNAQGNNGQADFSEIRDTLSPDVVLHQSPDLPFGGGYHGYDGYERWAVLMSSIFDQLEVSEQDFFENEDTVVVVCRFRTRSRRNGSVQNFPMVQVVRVQGEKIVEFRPFYWNVPAYTAAAVSKTAKQV